MKTFKPISKKNWKQSFKKWNHINIILALPSPDIQALKEELKKDCGYCTQYFVRSGDEDTECGDCPLFQRKVCVNEPYYRDSEPERPFWVVDATMKKVDLPANLKEVRAAAKKILNAIEKDRPGGC